MSNTLTYKLIKENVRSPEKYDVVGIFSGPSLGKEPLGAYPEEAAEYIAKRARKENIDIIDFRAALPNRDYGLEPLTIEEARKIANLVRVKLSDIPVWVTFSWDSYNKK